MARALPQPGEIIADKYLVTGLIGRGGMGAVYVVEHRLTGKRLAVKCLLPEHSEHPELVERFLREAQAAGRIQHRYVVDVFDVGRDGELLYIVMEMLDGKQLGDLLRDVTLPVEDVIVILVRAMEGVAAAHAQGIVHRDLKPENIIVCPGPSGKLDDPRVLDFGISKLEADAAKPLTRSGVMMGTPFYMSFEQISSKRDLDQRVDVYAMGVILYEALCGRVPYSGESVGALAVQMMSAPPVPLAELRPDLSPELVAVVMRAIALDRDERYPTMRALIDALSPFIESDLSKTPARGSAAARSSLPAYSSLRLTAGDAPTLSETPARADGRLRVDEVDESSRPQTAEHELPLGKIVLAALAAIALILVGIGLARRGAPDTPADAPAGTAHAPISRTEPAPQDVAKSPGAPVAASAEPIKGTLPAPELDAAEEPAAAAVEQNEAALDAGPAAPLAVEEEPESSARGKRGKKTKKRSPSLTLEQMVPKAPELPAEEREPPPTPAPVAPPEPAPVAPAPVAPESAQPEPAPAPAP